MKSDFPKDVNLTAIGSLLQTSLDTNAPLGEDTAADIITQLEQIPYDPKQISDISREIRRSPSFWTSGALKTLQGFFDIVHLPEGTGTQIFWGRGTSKKTSLEIDAPSIKELTDGSVKGNQVEAVLTQIYRDRFASNLQNMASIVRMPRQDLAKMIAGNSFPSLGEVLRMATALEVQPEAFINSWIADKFNQSINWQLLNKDGQFEPVSRRFLNLVYAADLIATDGKMDSIGRISIDIAGRQIDIAGIAAYADMALHAGFETSLVSDVVTDYIQSFDIRGKDGKVSNSLIDNYFEGSEDLMSNKYPRLATISSRLASLYWQKRGETGLAAIAEYNGAQGMVHVSWNGSDFENPSELSDPANWNRTTMGEAHDFLHRSAELTAQYELEEQITMSGPVVEETSWRLSFIEAIIAGDRKLAQSIVMGDESSAERISGVRLNEDELDDAWRAVSNVKDLWESGLIEPPVVMIKGLGYYLPPPGKSAEVYFNKDSGRYEKIAWSSAEFEENRVIGKGNGTSSNFAGFFSPTQEYLNGLDPNSKLTINRFEQTYPAIWGGIVKDERVDLVDQALTALGKKGEMLPRAAFATKLVMLMEEAGYLPRKADNHSIDGTEYDLSDATHTTFGGAEIPLFNSLGTARKLVK